MILIIEQDESLRDSFYCVMLSWGLEAKIVSNTTDGLAELECSDYNFILLDTGLYENRSIDFIEACKKKCPKSKLIIMSTMCPGKLETFASSNGVKYFITKPFEMDSLAEVLCK